MNKISKLFCLAILLFVGRTASAQSLEPKIKFTVRFEDAIGNKDSVIVGYDSLAAPYIDSIFGEIDLTEVPFDSVFEVRGADKGGQEFLSKIIVHGYREWMCIGNVQHQSINIYAKHFPVKITWDSTYFEHECYDWTHFTRNWYYLFHPSIYSGNIIRLYEQSEFLVTEAYLAQTETYRTSYLHSIEGGGEDTVFVMFIGLAGSEPTDAVEEPFGVPVKVSPNPATDEVRLELPEGFGEILYSQVYTIAGQVRWIDVRQNDGSLNWIINLSDWPDGIYTIKIVNTKGKMAIARFVKI
jgi:hypothetical protein